MRATYLICLGLGAGLAASLSGCKDLDQCDDPGAIEACMCPGDDPGARVCEVEYVWSDCDCGAEVPDSGVTGGMGGAGGMTGGAGGMTGGAGGMTGGAGGMTGGAGGMTGGAGGMTGGMGGMPDGGDTDAMTGGMGGGDPGKPPYGHCTMDTVAMDCAADSLCALGDAFVQPMRGACSPPCTMPSDCPAPEGSGFTAMMTCVQEHCILDCAPTVLLGQPLTCPTGMECHTPGLGQQYCVSEP